MTTGPHGDARELLGDILVDDETPVTPQSDTDGPGGPRDPDGPRDPSDPGDPSDNGDNGNSGHNSSTNTNTSPDQAARDTRGKRAWQDHVFRGVSASGGTIVLAVMTFVGIFLLYQGFQAISVAGFSFFTVEKWEPNGGDFGIAAVLFGTVVIAAIAILFAVPLATGTALYISEYAPGNVKQTLIQIVDLMAAVPSVVYGLWGMFLLEGAVLPVSQWISTVFGWIPFLSVDGFNPNDPLATPTVFAGSAFIAGIVVAMMVTPITASIMREVFSQAPLGEREGALALGSTKWGMITSVVLPFGRGGMIGGTMLGLGRALGETIAVYLVISPIFEINPHILQTGTNSISALIAQRYGEASPFEMSALMAAGLALFVMTLIVNFGASIVISRSRSGASSEA